MIMANASKQLKGMKGLMQAVKADSLEVSDKNRLQNNEQLEFLGDAVLEYLSR